VTPTVTDAAAIMMRFKCPAHAMTAALLAGYAMAPMDVLTRKLCRSAMRMGQPLMLMPRPKSGMAAAMYAHVDPAM